MPGVRRCGSSGRGTGSTTQRSSSPRARCQPSEGRRVVTVRSFAAARAVAGVAEESVDAPTLDALLLNLATTRGEPLARILSAASFLVNGLACRDRSEPLPTGATVDVLPPFAG